MIGMLLVSRSGFVEENAIEVFHHYGVHLFLFKLNVKFQDYWRALVNAAFKLWVP